MVADAGAWKGDLVSRVRVSNSLLSDVVTQFMAWDAETLRLLRRGEMPWRNRWAGEGAPLFANPQTAILSPFTWPRLLFGDVGWALCAILRFVAAALSMRWLARAMGASPMAAMLSGFVYAASGYSVLWLLYPLANVVAVLPALAAAALQRRPGLVVLFAALATIGGHPETLFCGVIAIAVLVVWGSGLRGGGGGAGAGGGGGRAPGAARRGGRTGGRPRPAARSPPSLRCSRSLSQPSAGSSSAASSSYRSSASSGPVMRGWCASRRRLSACAGAESPARSFPAFSARR
jgi:hypothetical protein